MRHLYGPILVLLLLLPAASQAAESPPSVRALLQGFADWEKSLTRVSGYCLDRAYVAPHLLVFPTPEGPVAANQPPPLTGPRAGVTYGAYFLRFGVHGGTLSYATAPLIATPEPALGSSPGSMSVSFAGGNVTAAGGAAMTPAEMPGPTLKPLLLPPLASLLPPLPGLRGSGQSLPTFLLSLLPAEATAQTPPPAGRVVQGPVLRLGERPEYTLALRAGGGENASWEVSLCPEFAGAPTTVAMTLPPAGPGAPELLAGGVLRQWRYLDYRELVPGLWVPGRILYLEFLYPPAGEATHEAHARTHELTYYRLAVAPADTQPTSLAISLGLGGGNTATDPATVLRGQFPELADDPAFLQQIAQAALSLELPPWPESLAVSPFPPS